MTEEQDDLTLVYMFAFKKGEESAKARVDELEAALQSIAANTCCDKCQQAALVARAALAEKKDG
jgi:plasmid stabilization system protein ParE